MADNIRVAVRIRPLIKRELNSQCPSYWAARSNQIFQMDSESKRVSQYSFDNVFDAAHSNSDVYNEVAKPIVQSAMQGFNGTIFAYGQTSSGKTHTVMGDENDSGIIPLVINEIYDFIENSPERVFCVRVSYLEIYNESVTDLLTGEAKLRIHENPDGSVYLEKLEESVISDPNDFSTVLTRGEGRRRVGETNMNEKSSRSHTIFRIIIESREENPIDEFVDNQGVVVVSHLNIVDLAGSERVGQTGAVGERFKESCAINKSLFMLSQVISRLSEGDGQFVNYRDSKLTRILQNSLGGNSKTAIICTVTPVAIDETHSTLKFASRAKTIKNKPIKNEVLTDDAMLRRYQRQIKDLKTQVQQLTDASHVQVLQAEKAGIEAQLKEKEEKIQQLSKLLCFSSKTTSHLNEKPIADRRTQVKMKNRRETWCIGPLNQLSLTPLLNRPNEGSLQSWVDWKSEHRSSTADEKCPTVDEEHDGFQEASPVVAGAESSVAMFTGNLLDKSVQAGTDWLAVDFNECCDVELQTDAELCKYLTTNEDLKETADRSIQWSTDIDPVDMADSAKEEELARCKTRVELLEVQLLETRKYVESSVDEAIRDEIIRICTENEALKQQLASMQQKLAKKEEMGVTCGCQTSFAYNEKSSTDQSTDQATAAKPSLRVYSQTDANPSVQCEMGDRTKEVVVDDSNRVSQTEFMQISNICEQLMCEKDDIQQKLMLQAAELLSVRRRLRLAQTQLRELEDTRNSKYAAISENDSSVEFQQNEVLLSEETDDLKQQVHSETDMIVVPLEMSRSVIIQVAEDCCPVGQLINFDYSHILRDTTESPMAALIMDVCTVEVQTDSFTDPMLEEKLGEMAQNNSELTSALRRSEIECDLNKTEVAKLSEQKQLLTSSVETVSQQLLSAQIRVDTLLGEKYLLDERCKELCEKVCGQQTELLQQIQEISKLRGDVKTLTETVRNREKCCVEADEELSEEIRKNDELGHQVEELNIRLQLLEKELESLRCQRSSEDEDLTAFKKDLAQRDATILQLQQQMAVAKFNSAAKIDSLQKDVQRLQEKISVLKQDSRVQLLNERDDTVVLLNSRSQSVVTSGCSATGSGIMDEYKVFSLETVRHQLEKELAATKKELVTCRNELDVLRSQFLAQPKFVEPSETDNRSPLKEVNKVESHTKSQRTLKKKDRENISSDQCSQQ